MLRDLDEHIVLSGYARDAVSLYINNKEIGIETSGKFEYDYALEQGENNIANLKGFFYKGTIF